jgi:hypothetical protein
MPSVKGLLVHQLTVDYEVSSCLEFRDVLNDNDFILCHQHYRKEYPNGEVKWEDRGEIILNTSQIGKVQKFIEYEKDYNYDEPYQHTDYRRQYSQPTRKPLRPY